jgi:hypothetical protein
MFLSGRGDSLGAVLDRTGWPVVTVAVAEPSDLDRLADELELLLSEERPFALNVVAPTDLSVLQEMLWQAPAARRRLRRQRARLAAWCEAAAHVLDPLALAYTSPSTLRYAELIWGCPAIAADCRDQAVDKLLALLAERESSLQMEAV